MNKIRLKKQKGAIYIIAGTLVIMVISFTALAVDLGRLFVVKSELQKAADAGALAGAAKLYPVDVNGNPNWSAANAKTLSIIQKNKSEGALLLDASISTGYWDLTGTTKGIIAPPLPSGAPSSNIVAAIKITVSRSAGHNGGPVPLYFGRIFNVKTSNVSSSAVAFVGFPNAVPAHSLFPLAMPISLYNTYWDSTKGAPKIDPSTGQPYVFNINASSGNNGNWTSFLINANDVPTIQDLIINGNPSPLAIGDAIWIEPGVKTSIFSSVPTDKDVAIPIVNDTTKNGTQPIQAFGTIHIISTSGGSNKMIQARFNGNYQIPGATLGGPNYGVYIPPRLGGQ